MKEEILKELKKEQKKMIKKFVVIIIAVAIIFGSVGVAAGSYNAKQMTYTPEDNTWKVNNVSDAIDDLKFKKVSNNYSTEEQVVGTWVDGKPIYQKSLKYVGADGTLSAWNTVCDVSILLIDTLVDTKVIRQSEKLSATFVGTINNNDLLVSLPDNRIKTNDYVIIQYTKTTDNETN